MFAEGPGITRIHKIDILHEDNISRRDGPFHAHFADLLPYIDTQVNEYDAPSKYDNNEEDL